jgi:hypothetical protein
MNKLLVVIFVFGACLFGYLMFSPIKGLRGLTNELEELNSRVDRLEKFFDLDLDADEEEIK